MAIEMKDVIFTSCAFGPLYIEQQRRLRQSILNVYPDANILFFEGRLPDASRPFVDSLYGFKPHAIQEARQHFSKVIWFDPAMLLLAPIDGIVNHDMIAVKDESRLSDSISNKYLNYQGVTREDVRLAGWNLVGGSFLYFNFREDSKANTIFHYWKEDEAGGWFGSQQEQASEQINSHRNDETCLAFRMRLYGVSPSTPESVGYCTSENAIMQKKHFK